MEKLKKIEAMVKSSYLKEKVKCECIYITKDSPMEIRFKVGANSYANKNLIHIGVSPLLFEEDEYNIYVSTMATAIHESFHYICSNFLKYSRFIKLMSKKGMSMYPNSNIKEEVFDYIAATIGNCIEDGRIENIACTSNKRYNYFIRKSNEIIWNKRDVLEEKKTEFDDFFHALISLSVIDSLPKNFDKKYDDSQKIVEVLKEIYPLIIKGKNSNTFEKCLRTCEEIFDAVIDYLVSIADKKNNFEYEYEFTNNPSGKDAQPFTGDIDSSKIKPAKDLPKEPNKKDKEKSNEKGNSSGQKDGKGEKKEKSQIENEVEKEVNEKIEADKQEQKSIAERNSRRPLDIKSLEDIMDKYNSELEFHNTFEIEQDLDGKYILEGKQLRKVFEENIRARCRVQTKRRKTGLVNGADIHRIFTNKDDIFRKRPPKYESISVEIILDMSGSMGGSKYEEATHALSVIEYALAGLYPTKIIGFNTGGATTHYYLIRDFNDKTNKINYSASFAKTNGPNNANRDGVIIDVAATELSKRKEDKKILIVLSDGCPNSCYSQGTSAIEEVTEAVKKAYKSGIDEVIPIYFGDLCEDNQSTFKTMYLNRNIIYCEFNEVTNNLKKVIKRVVLS